MKRRRMVRREHAPLWLLVHCGKVGTRATSFGTKQIPLRRRLDLLAKTKMPGSRGVAPLADSCFRRRAA